MPLAAALCLMPWVSAGVALLLGIAVALAFGNPFLERTRGWTQRLLAWSVMGLGAGMNLGVVARVGAHGIGYTMIGIGTTLVLGIFLGRVLGTERDASLLITAGTAICGGSAIAAVAPTIGARPQPISVALGTVFLLNAAALFLFPWVGHHFQLTETQFGLWSALAIHDTSSVVAATLQYGVHALEVGTTVKLARALWIVPLTLGLGALARRSGAIHPSGTKPKRPWFILGFVAMAAMVTWIPSLRPAGQVVASIAKQLLTVTLFLIGSNLTRATLRSVGAAPLLQGLLLWAIVAGTTLGAVLAGWIR